MSSFVLVPGACHGGWWYEPLVAELQRAGHRAIALTLAGLGPDGLAGTGQVTLSSHVAEVAAAVTGDSEPVVLVGHSYAGSVITGAADQVPQNVRAMVYLDAFVPEDGDSCWSMTNDEQRRWYLDGAGRTGLTVDPLPFFDPQARPHPLASLVQRSTLTGAWRGVPRKSMSPPPAGHKTAPPRSATPPTASPPTRPGPCTGGTPATTSCTTAPSDCSSCCWPPDPPTDPTTGAPAGRRSHIDEQAWYVRGSSRTVGRGAACRSSTTSKRPAGRESPDGRDDSPGPGPRAVHHVYLGHQPQRYA